MSIRYSFSDFTTRGHGVIEYADPHSTQDGQKKRRRRKVNSKLATRWPSAAPLKRKSPAVAAVSHKTADKRALEVFKKRYPGQQPKKGQIKLIKKELGLNKKTITSNKPKITVKSRSRTPIVKPNNPLDTLALARFSKLHPGQKPSGTQLSDIRQEIANARSKLGL